MSVNDLEPTLFLRLQSLTVYEGPVGAVQVGKENSIRLGSGPESVAVTRTGYLC